MLILTRKIGESLIIRDDILVKIVDVQGGQVRVGIQAPDSVGIYREEIHNKIKGTLAVAKKPAGLLRKIFT